MTGSLNIWKEAGHRLHLPSQDVPFVQGVEGVKQRQCFRSPGILKKQSSSIRQEIFSSSTISISSRSEQSATKQRPRWQLKLKGHCRSCLHGNEAMNKAGNEGQERVNDWLIQNVTLCVLIN